MGDAHQHGLGLIVERMGGEKEIGTDLARSRCEKRIARGARPLLEARLRPSVTRSLGPARSLARSLRLVPSQDGVRQAACGGKAADLLGFGTRGGAQAVIDGRDLDLPIAPTPFTLGLRERGA